MDSPSPQRTPPIGRTPTGSTASEDLDAAIASGRLTLEEVVNQLNDVDGASRRVRSTGENGVLITARLPFLSSLFPSNRGLRYRGVIVDEEDFDQDNNPISDIFLWRFPLVSLIWFLTLQLVYFLHVFANYSLFTIVWVLALWQLILDFGLSRILPVLQRRGLVPKELDIQDSIRKYTFFNPELVKRVGSVTYEIADFAIGMWQFTVLEASLVS
jgi:hypothetical protein